MSTWITAFITTYGYGGVFLLMVAENIFPPIPSEVVLPFIGQAVAAGEMNFGLALFAATAGSLIGTTAWFMIGRLVSVERLTLFLRSYGGYIAITERDFKKATTLFTKFKVPAVFFGRMIPGVRSVISIPAGSVRMSPRVFLWYSLLGSAIWNATLMTIGYLLLRDFTLVAAYINPITNGIVICFVLVYLLQVLRFIFTKNRV